MATSWRVSVRVGSEPRILGEYSKKSDAMKELKAFINNQYPVDEYDSAQAVPYKDGNRDWKIESVRYVPKHGWNANRRFTWRKGEGIR